MIFQVQEQILQLDPRVLGDEAGLRLDTTPQDVHTRNLF